MSESRSNTCSNYLLVVFETDLAYRHASVLFEVRPGRVYDGDIVLLVACVVSERTFEMECY